MGLNNDHICYFIADSPCYSTKWKRACTNGGRCVEEIPYIKHKCECPAGFSGQLCGKEEKKSGEHSVLFSPLSPVHRHFICPIIQQYAHLHEYDSRRAGQQRPIRTLTAALKRSIKTVTRCIFYHTHIHLTALFPGLPGPAGTRKAKPIWILLKQETVSGSGISCTICKSAPSSRQITTPAPHHSIFLQAGCPSCHPTNSVKALKASAYSITQIKI